jgi:hypothetical protein
MLDAIEGLRRPARSIWARCTLREFNIGYDCGDEPWAYNDGLAHETLSRIARAGASMRITLYPPTPRQEPVRKRNQAASRGRPKKSTNVAAAPDASAPSKKTKNRPRKSTE